MARMGTDDVADLPADALKGLGNSAFSDGNYQNAIFYYSLAIKKQSNVSSYYSNRALCYVHVQEHAKALLDCKRSIDLDPKNLKAYFFAGQAHIGLGQWDEAIANLVHAQELAIEQRCNFGDNLASTIRLAKRQRFAEEEKKRKQDEIELQVYLNGLIHKDVEQQKLSVLNSSTKLQLPKSDCSPTTASDPSATNGTTAVASVQDNSGSSLDAVLASTSADLPPAVLDEFARIDSLAEQRITELNNLFNQVDAKRANREVPDYLCGRISFELMTDPVITPSGITYDRKSLLAHLRKVGHFDPLTRQPLTEDQLIPNLAMKEVVHNFIEENPWAESY